jgi:threonine dehydrogenase-like Zn-dependent dehydrogenase
VKSYQLVSAEKIELQDVPIPEPEPGEVRVRVQACSICSRTDLVYYLYCGIKPHCRPGHFGHEVAGTIDKLGAGAASWREGDRVFLRHPARGGGFSEYVIARDPAIGRLPDHMTFVEGAPCQQVPIAVNATRSLRTGDHAAIIGQGSAGLQLLQLARIRGAAKVAVADLYDARLDIARQLGADVLISASHQDTVAEIRGVFPEGPDVIYDAVGIRSVAQQCVDAVRHEGTVCIFGTHHVEDQVTFNLVQWEAKALNLHMANEGSRHSFAEAMRIAERLLANRLIETKPYITHVFDLEDLPKAIELLKGSPILYPEGDPRGQGLPPKEALKVVIRIGPEAERTG